MDGQGDGDHNGPNRYRTSVPVADLPPTDDSDDDDDDDDDDHDDVGDEEDTDSVFLMHLFVNHYMRFFVNPRAPSQQPNAGKENIVSDLGVENRNADQIAVGAEAEFGVDRLTADDEEEDPQPGPSNRSREDEDEMRSSSRYFCRWHEFDNSSDGSADSDDDEQDAAPGGPKKRSRDDRDGNLRLRGDLSLPTPSGHRARSSENPADDERAPKVGRFHSGQRETAEDTPSTYAEEKSRENYDTEKKSGKKRFKR